jgi:glycosyltransferase involved in cell wall biosynthesis
MINSDRFWRALKTRKLAIVGRRASEAREAFGKVGVAVACTMDLEGYDEIEKVYSELSERDDWDAAILAAGIPATILAPMLAQKTNRVVIDFGHALDMLIDGEDFDYEKILARWKEEAQIKIPVSIVMAVYNGEKFIEEAIESALTQSYENIELIIVNDGSTDSTREILDKITDERVKIIHLEQNQGAANALNVGIDNAKGFWIAILDADDIYYPTKIEEQVRYSLTHYGVVGIGTMIDCIPGSKEISKGYLLGVANGKNSYISSHDIRDGIYWGCPLTHSSMMFRKDTFMQVCGYDTDFKIAYDYDLWLKLSEKGELENIPKVLLSYRLHKQSLSNKDNYATVDEIQIVSSRGIYRLLNKGGKVQPKAAVIGPYKAVRNYMDKIAPAAGLEVKAIEYRNWKAKISNVIKEIMTGQTDALIMLDDSRNDNFISLYAKKYLKLNDNFFVIYNILK